VQDHVGHDLEGFVQMFIQETGVHDGVLPRRGRVELAAKAIKDLGDLNGVEARTALEQQVLDEVADTALIGQFVAGTRPDPEAQ
jgi:hypothetical protein